MVKKNIAVLVGSLRAASLSRQIAQQLIRLAPEELQFQILEIGDLPLYNEDLESQRPASWTRFRNELAAADGFLFVTPEYNRSVPGLLKNAIDVGSRPSGKSSWGGRPGAVISLSPGLLGAFGANHHLRQSMVFLDVFMMQQPEIYLSQVGQSLDADGHITQPDLEKRLNRFLEGFGKWMKQF